jgi:hypothetical protein
LPLLDLTLVYKDWYDSFVEDETIFICFCVGLLIPCPNSSVPFIFFDPIPTQEKQIERREATCDPSGLSSFPQNGRENSERLLLKEGAITRLPKSLCNNVGAKNVILVMVMVWVGK